MTVNVEVRSEEPREFTTKNGRVHQQLICCLDMDPAGAWKNTFDYIFTEEEERKHSGQLVGRRVTLCLHDGQVFNGRLRATGKVLKVDGAVAAAPVK